MGTIRGRSGSWSRPKVESRLANGKAMESPAKLPGTSSVSLVILSICWLASDWGYRVLSELSIYA